jgi:RsiW-degrading membrane proteinase PrsW (M82 family)
MNGPAIPPRVRRLLPVISWIGLAVSVLTLLVSMPQLIDQGGGFEVVFGNVAKFGWTLALLLLIFASTRTIGARALVGAALAGFFGVSSLTVMAGRPFVVWLGPDNLFVPVLFAPVTEELFKLAPVAMFVLLAARNSQYRPSVSDAVLFGVAVASGFTVYENILYARGTDGGWLTTLPFSALLPFLTTHGPMLVGTHIVYTGLASLALGATIMYRHRFPALRFALPVALMITIGEHATVNRLTAPGALDSPPLWVRATLAVTLGGHLSTLLFLAGVITIAIYETRLLKRGGASLPPALAWRDVLTGIRSSPKLASLMQLHRRLRYESMRRSTIFAVAQTEGGVLTTHTTAAVATLYGNTGLAITVVT